MDGSVWRPVAPDGYGSIGDYWQSGYDKPNPDKSMWMIKNGSVCLCVVAVRTGRQENQVVKPCVSATQNA